MTRAEIIAELRRSAREDADPWYGARSVAFVAAAKMCQIGESMGTEQAMKLRTFFLFVACALEDEC